MGCKDKSFQEEMSQYGYRSLGYDPRNTGKQVVTRWFKILDTFAHIRNMMRMKSNEWNQYIKYSPNTL